MRRFTPDSRFAWFPFAGRARRRDRLTAVSIGALAATFLLTGCSPVLSGVTAPTGQRCADVYAAAMSSRQPVRGAWSCLTPTLQGRAREGGYTGDSGMAQIAAIPPVYDRHHYLGRLADGGFVYALSGRSGASALMIWLDGDGRIASLKFSARPQQ